MYTPAVSRAEGVAVAATAALLALYLCGTMALLVAGVWSLSQLQPGIGPLPATLRPLASAAIAFFATTLLLMMLRPLLARDAVPAQVLPLSAAEAPGLLALAFRVKESLQLTHPPSLFTSWQALNTLLPSCPGSPGPRLLIGLPVMAALTTEELIATVAKLLANAETRRTNPARRFAFAVATFFQRAATGFDTWEEILEDALRRSRDTRALLLLLVSAIAQCGRLIFIPLHLASHAALKPLVAQQESELAQVVAHFGDTAASAARKCAALQQHEHAAAATALQNAQTGLPPANLSRLVVENAVRFGTLKLPANPASNLLPKHAELCVKLATRFHRHARGES
jgi:hypothetical protein